MIDYEITGDEELDFIVVFKPGNDNFWWQRLLKKGFGHCYVLIANGDKTLMINHHGFRISITEFDCSSLEFAIAQVDKLGHKALSITYKPNPKPTYRIAMSCVGLVINVIGIRYKLALTPYSLYRSLVKLGAKEV